jgi:hypothetical protein
LCNNDLHPREGVINLPRSEKSIVLRDPRELGFAAWVIKPAKATGPG